MLLGASVLLATLSISNAKVEFTYSTMYDVFDFPGGVEIPLPRCDTGCLLYASIGGVNDPSQYIKNLIINDSVKGNIQSVAEVATNFQPGTSQKLPLEITAPGKYSIKNLNAPADTASDVTVWIIDRTKAQAIEYEIYDAAYMGRVPSIPKNVLTIMGAARFTVYADKGEANSYTAWQAGFDNALSQNPDRCEYVIKTDDSEINGFKFPVDAPIISFVFDQKQIVTVRADYSYLNTRSMSKEGFITSPGYHGCSRIDKNQVHRSTSYHNSDQVELHGEPDFYQVNIDAITDIDDDHLIDVMDLASGTTTKVGGKRTDTAVTLPKAQIMAIYYKDMAAPQSFLMRYTTSLKGQITTTTTHYRTSSDGKLQTTTSTFQPSTSAVGVATAVAAFAVVMSKLLALRDVMQNN